MPDNSKEILQKMVELFALVEKRLDLLQDAVAIIAAEVLVLKSNKENKS